MIDKDTIKKALLAVTVSLLKKRCNVCWCFIVCGSHMGNTMSGDSITKSQAMYLLKLHGNTTYTDLKDFIKEFGNAPFYKKQSVIIWLGY